MNAVKKPNDRSSKSKPESASPSSPSTAPQSQEAEAQVIAMALIDEQWFAQAKVALQPADFYNPLYRHIFECMLQLDQGGRVVDAVQIASVANPEICTLADLSAISDSIPFSAMPHYSIRLIVEKSQLRQIWGVTQRIGQLISDQSNLQKCMDYFDRRMREIRNRSTWPVESDDSEQWRESLTWDYNKTTGKKSLEPSRLNIMRVLSCDNRLHGCLMYDEFRQDIVCLNVPPWNEGELGLLMGQTAVGGTWFDEDYTRLACWLEHEYKVSIPRELLAELVHAASRKETYHPIRDILEGMQWDGVPRLDSWCRVYLGSTQSEKYLSLVGARWMISAVARIYQPGCQAQHVLILEGGQGLGKSTALRTLATIGGRSWFADSPLQLAQPKDVFPMLQGIWIVELAELDSLIRAEDSTAKSFFTSASDRYRPAYMRVARDFPRQCVFAGSINPESDGYLRDMTGGRRYWPVFCQKVDMTGLRADRDQLWAEAVHRYKAGEIWHPETPEEKEACAIEQAERRQEDPWQSEISAWLHHELRDNLTAAEILHGAVSLPIDRISRKEQWRLGQIMSQIPAWKPDRVWRGKDRVRGYVRVL